MDINQAFPSKYLKASDLGGKPRVVTIDRVEYEEVGKARDRKAVLYLRELPDKGIVLNKTNATTIMGALQSGDTDEWTGQKIVLFEAQIEFQGTVGPAIRVRKYVATQTPKPVAKPEPEWNDVNTDEVPF